MGLHFAGGATAVLLGWRASTIDVDILIVPEVDALLRALPELKEDLQINVELPCPLKELNVIKHWCFTPAEAQPMTQPLPVEQPAKQLALGIRRRGWRERTKLFVRREAEGVSRREKDPVTWDGQ